MRFGLGFCVREGAAARVCGRETTSGSGFHWREDSCSFSFCGRETAFSLSFYSGEATSSLNCSVLENHFQLKRLSVRKLLAPTSSGLNPSALEKMHRD